MQNVPTPPRKIHETLAPQQDLTSVGTTTPKRMVTKMPSLDRLVTRQICFTKSLVGIVGGLGLTLMAVGLFEYPGQSTTSTSDKPLAASVTGVATGDAPNSSTCDRQARAAMAAAQSAVSEAKRAIALSQADVAQADINIQTFKAKYERDLELHRNGTVNSQQLAQSRSAHDFGKQQKQIALEGLKHAQGQLHRSS